MNVEISPDIDLAMRKQIERAVRLVHAGKDRKLAMREELLAHLTAIYAEERERQPDDQAALAVALRRFGEPAALTSELDSSVGFSEKIAYHVDRREDAINRVLRHWFTQPTGGTWFRLALRSLFALVLFNLTFFGIVLLASVLVRGWPSNPPTLLQWPKVFVLFIVSQVTTIATMRKMMRTFDNRSRRSRWLWVSAQAFLWSLFAATFTVPFRWSLDGSLPTLQEVADVAVSFAVGLSPFFVFGVWCMNHAKQYRKRLELWTTLAIDD